METVCIKIDDDLAKAVEKHMKKNHYTTKTELFRESVRNTIKQEERKEKEVQEVLKNIRKYYGSVKTRTTDKQLREAREKAFEELSKELDEKY
ncbi:ribbon-helix-helix protein, CopG family [Candidatus Woesearchaeota archaeon]|nr:ribbon-helix-helix protein, CopG family [Candidatus Woesearchaeota archaeon]